MNLYVLGAPGSGKSAVLPALKAALPSHVVIDWDAFMEPAGELAGTNIRTAPRTWAAYEHLVRVALEAVAPVPTVLLGVATPDQLAGWPGGRWLLLDCGDAERRARLASRGDATDVSEALADAAAYRALGLPAIDTTGLDAETVAAHIASWVRDWPT
ncbi:hypothetical protein [Actinomadura pelletieri]|uniref:hypothetical protein n=1 Tax=Actinomadura pelletieri TaxID=111805 RepID=UPI0011C39C1F|nr:hypothetical protein [Actinomadura pelletieri]